MWRSAVRRSRARKCHKKCMTITHMPSVNAPQCDGFDSPLKMWHAVCAIDVVWYLFYSSIYFFLDRSICKHIYFLFVVNFGHRVKWKHHTYFFPLFSAITVLVIFFAVHSVPLTRRTHIHTAYSVTKTNNYFVCFVKNIHEYLIIYVR